ncbi:hypothetical protein ACLB1E_36130 [Escherichia coli]
MRWNGGWCRTNSGRQRDEATITRITVNWLNDKIILGKVSVVSV